jgi:hypothetical protein
MNFKKVQSVKVDGSTRTPKYSSTRSRSRKTSCSIKNAQAEDETWSVVGMENLQEFLASMSAKKAEKLSVLNKPLAKKLAERIAITSSKFEHKKNNRFGVPMPFLLADGRVQRRAGGGVCRSVDVFNKNGEKLFPKFVSSGLSHSFETGISVQLVAEPLRSNEKTLIATPGRELSVKTEIIRQDLLTAVK